MGVPLFLDRTYTSLNASLPALLCRYPNRYEQVIATLCENLETLDEPEAKASMIWIIGQYADRIENADELLESFFLETFADETPQVQLQVRRTTTPQQTGRDRGAGR